MPFRKELANAVVLKGWRVVGDVIMSFGCGETHWLCVHIGFENDAVTLGGLNIHQHEWRPACGESIHLPHPAYPNQIHAYSVYETGDLKRPVRFAVCELSAGVYGFYTPASWPALDRSPHSP